jgi:hypothetical protein
VSRRRILCAAALIAGSAAAGLLANTKADAGPSAPGFAIPSVVNHWVPGNEPDVAIDKSPASRGLIYNSWPNGFSTTISYIHRSGDEARSFHPTEANLLGKPLTCAGGGDTDLQISPVNGQMLVADLQSLTNFSNSSSTNQGRSYTTTCTAVPNVDVDRQWIAIDTNGGTSTLHAGAAGARAYFDYDTLGAQNPLGNTLVMNSSNNGVDYGGGVGCTSLPAGVNCLLPPAIVTPDEGLPGNDMVDNTHGPFAHTIYAFHNNSPQNAPLLSYCRGPASGVKTAATVAAACTAPTGFPNKNPLWHDVPISPPNPKLLIEAFVAGAMDTQGGLYATWAQYPIKGTSITGPGAVMTSHSVDGGQTWSKAQRVSPTNLPTVIFPWISAGDPGRVDIAYYGASEASENHHFGPDALTQTGTWDLYLDQSLDTLGTKAHFTHVRAADHQIKWGNISTQGFGVGTTSDRSLGDFLQVQTGVNGEAVISYVDDTSENRNPDFTFGSGESPPEAAGPTMIAVQTGGPSLYKSVGTLSGDTRRPYGKVSDPTGKGFPDAYLSLAGSDTNGPAAMDIGGVTITQADRDHLRITMSVADKNLANDLAISPTLGGTTADWLVRWAAPSYKKPNGQGGFLGDGDIFYVGMESTLGGAPKFFGGSTDSLSTTHAKYFIYDPKTTIPGTVNGGTITWTVPLSAVGSPPSGAGLYSVTGFTSTQVLPGTQAVHLPNNGVLTSYTPPNLIDAAPPTTYRIGSLTPGVPGSLKPPGQGGGKLATTGLPYTVPLAAVGLIALAMVVRQRRRHSATT